MVVRGGTKKWLMDNGLDQYTAHLWADNIMIGELVKMDFNDTMNHLYQNCNFHLSRLGYRLILDKETFLRDGPPKDMGFYPFSMTFRNRIGLVGTDIRYDDYIYQYIRGVKREEGLRLSIPTSQYLNIMTEWGKRDKPQMTFINYDTLPFNEKS